MYSYKIDVAVLLVFFNRPEVLKKTFEQIKKARPSVLLLYQDGPRDEKPEDKEKIIQCRKIVENIDWECTVYRKYQTNNFGCDPSGYIAHKWAFENVDKCIIIEDDIVCSQSFFTFCKEMLDKYENDKRVYRICGMNHLEQYLDCDSDYFFTNSGAIWGWATWKRVMDEWDSQYKFLSDEKVMKKMKVLCKANYIDYKTLIGTCKKHKDSGREHFESIYNTCRILHSGLSIVPQKNMITNIGLTCDSTHATSNINRLPKGIRRVFFMNKYEINFPLKHPQFIINDLEYTREVNKVMGNNRLKKNMRRVEAKIRAMIYK